MAKEMDAEVAKALDTLVVKLTESNEYKEFHKQKDIVIKSEDLQNKVLRLVKIREELSNIPENERDSEYAERLENEYADLQEETIIYDYTTAELNMCNLFQDVLVRIVDIMKLV